MTTQPTIESAIIAAKCRKGESKGTTKKGAFWLATTPIKLRSFGGDGIGQSRADCRNYLQLRHFRDGTVQAVVHFSSYHQNHGDSDIYRTVPILGCQSAEEVIVVLKGVNDGDEFPTSAYSDWGKDFLEDALASIGIPAALPPPDED